MNISNAYKIINGKLIHWFHDFIRLLPNIFFAAVALTTGLLLARLIKKLTRRLFRKVTHNPSLNNLLVSTVHIFIIGITVFTALTILQLDKAVTSILAGAGIIGLALAFAFQDIAANFISGIFISFRQPIRVGHIVQIKEYMGKVTDVNMRDTVIRTFQGQLVIIPNKDVFQSAIENYSMLGKRRFDLTAGISYGEDLEKVKQITLNALENLEGLSAHDETTFFYTGFGDSSIDFTVRIWICDPEQHSYLHVGSQAIVAIKKVYDQHGIMLPFPIRTLDFGIKGGVTLKEMLQADAAAQQ